MKPLALIIALLNLSFATAQEPQPFKGTFYNKDNDITIALDLYDTTLVAPNYSFLGKLNGYMTGKLYDAWFVTTYKIDKGKAVVAFSNDLGSDEQKIQFSFNNKGELVYEVQGSNAIRRSENRRWIKLPTKMVFTKKDAAIKKRAE